MVAPAQVTRDQRHTKNYPCRVCQSHAELPQGKGIRCAGFRSADGEWEHCQREQYAGALPLDESTTPPTYAHRLRGECKCGATHGPALVQPARRLPSRETRYELRDASGTLRGVHVRIDFLDSAGKPYQPKRMFWKEHHGLSSLEMPLYNLAGHLSASTDALRILCEGEKAADALNAALKRAGRADMLALATVTGAPAFPCDASLQPLRGVPVALWADNDADGRKQMERIAERLEAMGAEPPRWVEWKDAPAKGDAADFFARGGTVEQLAKMVSGQQSPEREPHAHSTADEKRGTASQGPTIRRWPKALDASAYYGVLGKIAREMEPYIEADSAGLLINLITTAGVTMGRGPYIQVGAKRHYPCLYVVNVGATGDNKGDAWWPIDTLLGQVTATAEQDGAPLKPMTWGGMSTGEGLLWQVRDERKELHQDRRSGITEEIVADAGVTDKRLLAYEPEFARVLAVMYREGNTLSMILRDLYDGASVARSSPKSNPITATGAHFGVVGQITPEELNRKLHEVELFNGFANRFLWILTKRLRSLPNPPAYTADKAEEHARAWSVALAKARAIGEVTRDDEAADVWETIYETLRTAIGDDGMPTRSGMAIEVCARAHVHVLRIALIFAALDGSPVITSAHQEAALAIWDYAEASAMYLFGNVGGDPLAEVIYDALRGGKELNRTQISHLFGRHADSGAIQGALDSLRTAGRAQVRTEKTAGAPRELWSVCSAETGGNA